MIPLPANAKASTPAIIHNARFTMTSIQRYRAGCSPAR
jgi:hypothetical protein